MKYTLEIGPDSVAYKCGYEMGQLNIDGIKMLRERDVLDVLKLET
jgi:hypothetical protein